MVLGFTAVILLFAIQGVVEVVKRAFDRDWRSVTIIILSAATGGLFGYFKVEVPTPLIGAVVGFAASGVITTQQNNGQKREGPRRVV